MCVFFCNYDFAKHKNINLKTQIREYINFVYQKSIIVLILTKWLKVKSMYPKVEKFRKNEGAQKC